jgi:D-alanyl-D-alanine carboxypeptidase
MSTAHTGNGWPVLDPTSPQLHTWVIPGTNREITMRNGSIGFILAVWALWWNDIIERLDIPGVNDPVDEGGYNHRPLTGTTDSWSEHAAGAAEDLNWRKHPYNVAAVKTFTRKQIRLIHAKLRRYNTLALGKVIEWGGDWPSWSGSTAKTDGMHTQVVGGMKRAERLAKLLTLTRRGRRVLKANSGQRRIIFS